MPLSPFLVFVLLDFVEPFLGRPRRLAVPVVLSEEEAVALSPPADLFGVLLSAILPSGGESCMQRDTETFPTDLGVDVTRIPGRRTTQIVVIASNAAEMM